MNLEGYAAWLGMPVGASKAVSSSTASAQEDNTEVQAGGQGPGFQQCVWGHRLLEQPLRKVQGTLILPRPDFPPFCPQESRTGPMQISIAWMWYTAFLNTHALDTGIRSQGNYVIRRVRCVIMSRVV